MSIDGTSTADLARLQSTERPRRRSTTTDVTDTWLAVFQRHIGTGGASERNGGESSSSTELASSVGRLRLVESADGTRGLDRTDFRHELPEPAKPGGGPSTGSAQDRRRAEIVSAYSEQIAAATSDAERQFEERQLELTLARLEGREPAATREENRAVIGQRWAFRQVRSSG